MRTPKARLTVTVDREVVKAGRRAVKAGLADSLSAWVNLALSERAATERRLQAMGAAIADYEWEFGVITQEEMDAQAREDRHDAVVVGRA